MAWRLRASGSLGCNARQHCSRDSAPAAGSRQQWAQDVRFGGYCRTRNVLAKPYHRSPSTLRATPGSDDDTTASPSSPSSASSSSPAPKPSAGGYNSTGGVPNAGKERQQQRPQPQAGPAGSPRAPPWALMGRMLKEDTIAFSIDQKQALVASAAASMSGLDSKIFEMNLQTLLTLLPDMRSRLLSLKPAILVELATDTAGVATKLIQLRDMYPAANISIMVSKRPTLLTHQEWPGVVSAHAKLNEMFPEGGVDRMVTQQPMLLVDDVDGIVGELKRLLPGHDCLALLRANPDVVTMAMSNRGLSIWLMPGVDVLPLLLRNPGIITSVQRGSTYLGPGAEFRDDGGASMAADWL